MTYSGAQHVVMKKGKTHTESTARILERIRKANPGYRVICFNVEREALSEPRVRKVTAVIERDREIEGGTW